MSAITRGVSDGYAMFKAHCKARPLSLPKLTCLVYLGIAIHGRDGGLILLLWLLYVALAGIDERFDRLEDEIWEASDVLSEEMAKPVPSTNIDYSA